MGIKRYFPSKDTTITDSYRDGFIDSGSLSNMGAADSLEVFYIANQAFSGSSEKSRILVQFPVSEIVADRNASLIPASGSASFYLKMFNAEHPFTLPQQFTLEVAAVSASWDEGRGLDMDEYRDLDEANWVFRETGTLWNSEGGDYHASPRFSGYFDDGTEDLEVDITPLVEEWALGTKENYGVGIFLTSSIEDGAESYYTKKFFARTSEYFHDRPVIEVRWDSSVLDDRGRFYASSSLANGADNLQNLYLYNFVRGQLSDIPAIGSTGSIFVTVHTSASAGEQLVTAPDDPVTASWVSTGVYRASFALNTTASVAYDRWSFGGDVFYTGTFNVQQVVAAQGNPTPVYYTSITNLKDVYSRRETARFRVFTRDRDWQPNVYTVATAERDPQIVRDAYYRVIRLSDGLEVIQFDTGSTKSTRLSYDATGSYFDLDMSLLQSDRGYAIQVLYYINGRYEEQPNFFRFRVE